MVDSSQGDRQIARLSEQMQATAIRLQEITGNLQSYLYEQGHLKEDVTEVRRVVQSVNQLLREGDPSLLTRLYIIEQKQKTLEDAQVRARDWWLRLLMIVAGAGIMALLGLFLTLYVGTKGGVVKP